MSENNPFDPVNFAKDEMGASKAPDPAEIQNQMAAIQKKLGAIEVEGKAGVDNYSVKVHMNGRHEATKVTIDPELLKQPDALPEIIASAVTDASHKAEQAIQTEMAALFQGMNLPG